MTAGFATLIRYNYSSHGEIILNKDAEVSIPAQALYEKQLISKVPLRKGLWSKSRLVNGERQDFDPTEGSHHQKVLYTGGALYDLEKQLFVSIFYDKFGSSTTRYQSVGGLYMSVMNLSQESQKRMENIFLLALTPPDTDFEDIWERYRQELLGLEREGFLINGDDSFKVRLGMVKADSPQRCSLSDHKGAKAKLICPRCLAKRDDIWDVTASRVPHRKGLAEALELLKDTLTEEDYNQVLENMGFRGTKNLFAGLNFDPYHQVPCEPYHLVFLGVLRFFFKRVVGALAPRQRDMINHLMRSFPFPRGTPKIPFDVTSKTKNSFWMNLVDAINQLFNPSQTRETVQQARGAIKNAIIEAKRLFPSVTQKFPQNIHNMVEFLDTDLELWVSSHICAGAKEEQKHQGYKNGLNFTHSLSSVSELTKKDVIQSSLRYLLHGGEYGNHQTLLVFFNSTFRSFCHPQNPFAPHPLFLRYSSSLALGATIYPRCFFSMFGARGISQTVTPSKQFVVEQQSFSIGDDISVVAKGGNPKSRYFLRIQEIVTLEIKANDWQFAEAAVKPVLVHHVCDGCNIHRACSHENCRDSCPLSSYKLEHTKTNQFFIEEHFKHLA